MHTDKGNYGLTVTILFKLRGQKAGSLRGGSHIIVSNAEGDHGAAVIVKDYAWGVIIIGEYARVLHASLAVQAGTRLCITCYCGAPILRYHGEL